MSDAETLAALIVLGNEWDGHALRLVDQVVCPDYRDGPGNVDPERLEGGQLPDLADFELDHRPSGNDSALVRFEPVQDGPCVVLRMDVPARVR